MAIYTSTSLQNTYLPKDTKYIGLEKDMEAGTIRQKKKKKK